MSESDGPSAAPGDGDWRSYRCPVCGHADEVALPEDEPLRIRCSHCETALEVERSGAGSERVSVHVASEDDDGETEDR